MPVFTHLKDIVYIKYDIPYVGKFFCEKFLSE